MFAAIESHMASSHPGVAVRSDGLTDLKARIKRIEDRLELTGPA